MIDPLNEVLSGFEDQTRAIYQHGKHVRLICDQSWDKWSLSMTSGWQPNALTKIMIDRFRETAGKEDWIDFLMTTVQFNIAGISLACGNRVFRPTAKQCASLMGYPVQPAKDFGLPYEAFYIVIPPEFSRVVEDKRRAKAKDNFDLQISYIGLCRSPMGALMYLQSGRHAVGLCPVVLPERETPLTIGDIIEINPDEDPNCVYEMQNLYWRIAINACYALTRYGRVGGYIDPAANRRHRQAARRDRGNDMLPRMDARRLILQQDLVDDLKLPPPRPMFEGNPEPTGRKMPPHTRRGHWHTYWTGPGRQQMVRKLLGEIQVHPEDFLAGQPPDTDIQGKD